MNNGEEERERHELALEKCQRARDECYEVNRSNMSCELRV